MRTDLERTISSFVKDILLKDTVKDTPVDNVSFMTFPTIIDKQNFCCYSSSRRFRSTLAAQAKGNLNETNLEGMNMTNVPAIVYFIVMVMETSSVSYHWAKKNDQGEWEFSTDDGDSTSTCSLVTMWPDLESATKERNKCVGTASSTHYCPDDPTSPITRSQKTSYWIVKGCDLVKFIHQHHNFNPDGD